MDIRPPHVTEAQGRRPAAATPRRRRLRRIGRAVLAIAAIGVFVLPLLQAWHGYSGCTVGEARCTLARQWSETISKLGIEPVFPPEEDLQVGDVFVVLTAIAGQENHDPLLSKAVKLAHIDMRRALDEAYATLPQFPERTGEGEAHAPDRTDVFAPVPNRDRLPLVAFPALSIQHALSLGARFGWLGATLLGRQQAEDTETIELTETVSYGVPALYATQALERFCALATAVCNEDGARRTVSYIVGTKYAFATDLNACFVNEVTLYLVNRVYLAGAIHQHRGNLSGSQAGVQAATEASAPGLQAAASDGSDILLNATYPRPMVIGFRAIHAMPVAGPANGSTTAAHACAPTPDAQRVAIAADPVLPAPAAPSAEMLANCRASGLGDLLCAALHPALMPPVYGNTRAISSDFRTQFESHWHQIPTPHAPPR